MGIKIDNLTKSQIEDLKERRIIDKRMKHYSEMIDGE